MIAEAVQPEIGSGLTPVSILGVPFDPVTTAQALDRIEQMIASGKPHYVVTANVDFVVQAQADVELLRILFDAQLVLCDGTPLVWASHLLGHPFPERVAGADLVPILIRIAAEKNRRLFFLGATPEAANQAAQKLRRDYPGLEFEFYSPPFKPLLEMDHAEIEHRIHAARPDLLFVALGCPKQEKWMAMHYRSLGVPVAIGVGATVDFLAGRVKRAPRWMQRIGTEWLFRLMQEPRRLFKRYATDLCGFSWRIAAQWKSQALTKPLPDCSREIRVRIRSAADQPPGITREAADQIELPAHFDAASVGANAGLFNRVLAGNRNCLLNVSAVTFIDAKGIGLLSHLQKSLNASQRQLVLVGPNQVIRRALRLMGLDDFFLIASDLQSGRALIEAHRREHMNSVGPRTPAAANPLLWQGEITAANADKVWDFMQSRINSPESPRLLVVDCARLRFVDSSGVAVMLRASSLARRRSVTLSFINLRPPVRNVLRFARCEELLQQQAEREQPQQVPAGELVFSQ